MKTRRAPVRIGLVGFGHHGQWAVVPAFREASGVQLKAVADLSPDNLVRLPDPDVSTYTDFRRMLRQETLDAVYVATRVETHAAITRAALQAGLHVITEGRLDTGVLVTINASFAFTAYIPQRLASANYDALAIVGEKGVIVLHQAPDGTRHLQLVSDTLTETVPFTTHGHTSVITLLPEDFATAVRKGGPLPEAMATGTDGLMAQLCMDKANRLAVAAGDSFASNG